MVTAAQPISPSSDESRFRELAELQKATFGLLAELDDSRLARLRAERETARQRRRTVDPAVKREMAARISKQAHQIEELSRQVGELQRTLVAKERERYELERRLRRALEGGEVEVRVKTVGASEERAPGENPVPAGLEALKHTLASLSDVLEAGMTGRAFEVRASEARRRAMLTSTFFAEDRPGPDGA